jgi:hypothetical protein
VRVWDVAGSDQVLKYEAKGALGGKVNDIAWDSESKRIIVVGEGRESFGRAFMADSGSSCGEISGHSKVRPSALRLRPLSRDQVGSLCIFGCPPRLSTRSPSDPSDLSVR